MIGMPASHSRYPAFHIQQGQDAGQILPFGPDPPGTIPVRRVKRALKEQVIRVHPKGNPVLLQKRPGPAGRSFRKWGVIGMAVRQALPFEGGGGPRG